MLPRALAFCYLMLLPTMSLAEPGADFGAEGCETRLTRGRAAGTLEQLQSDLRSRMGQETLTQMLRHFSVGTFNLMNYRSGGGSLRKTRIARAILQEAPYVLANQELESRDAYEELAASLGDTYSVCFLEGNKPRQHIGFLVRRDLRVDPTLISHREERLGEIPLFSRDFLILELKDPATGQPLVDIAGVHFKSRVVREGQPDPSEVRTAQVERSGRIMDGRRGRIPQIILGDFQGRMGTDPEFNFLRESGFVDIFDRIGLAEQDRYTHMYFPTSSTPILGQLDAVATRDVQAVLGGYAHRMTLENGSDAPAPGSFEERRRQGSDHDLVIGIVDLSAPQK